VNWAKSAPKAGSELCMWSFFRYERTAFREKLVDKVS